MNVLLVYPYHNTRMLAPPLGLGYMASVLRNAGHRVGLLDCINDGIKGDALAAIFSETSPELVGITAMSAGYPQVVETCKLVRKSCNAKIVIGGPHATALSEPTLRETGADFVIIGEGEKTVVELAAALEKKSTCVKKVDGLAYIDGNGKFTKTKQRALIENLDELPFPAWDLMPPDKYSNAPHGMLVKSLPVATIVTSRGCPYDCSFCASNGIWHRQFRMRSPKNVVDEIEFLTRTFGVREIHIEDDNFTLVKRHAMNICKGIIERGIKISWTCPNGVRADALDLELLRTMKESGCYLLSFGIESGSDALLKRHSKCINKSRIRNAIGLCKRVGIETSGFFIIGLPGETKETIDQTIRFSKELDLDRAHFSIFTPMPGSRLWNEMKDKINASWDKFSLVDVAYSSEIPEEELKREQKRAFYSFFMRPKIMLGMLRYFRPSLLGSIFKKIIQAPGNTG